MKKLLLLALILSPAVANAQSLGCFIDTGTLNLYGALFLCGQAQAYPTACASTHAANLSAFGEEMAKFCDIINDDENQLSNSLNQCNSSLNQASASQSYYFTQWSACGDTTKQINGAIGYWQGLATYWNGLYNQQTNRLAAALSKCGKKCKGL